MTGVDRGLPDVVVTATRAALARGGVDEWLRTQGLPVATGTARRAAEALLREYGFLDTAPTDGGESRPPRCYCGGCIGMGPCDDGTPCAHGCGGQATNQFGTCGRCEDELLGRDLCDDDGEEA